jgi:hypothetical protein
MTSEELVVYLAISVAVLAMCVGFYLRTPQDP